eukprot:m.299349 g.299349  ORF g.299349 m.299349 type:complete len:239 (-) comp14108_c0_seq1:309-1025(-)
MPRRPSGEHDVSDADFLARAQIGEHLNEVLTHVLELRPPNPVEFIAEHFESLLSRQAPIKQAYKLVRFVHYEQPVFPKQLHRAFMLLSAENSGASTSGRQCVVGSHLNQLLGLICSEFSPQASDILLQRFSKRKHEIVRYSTFRAAILACLMYEDFVDRAEGLFQSVETDGYVEKEVCELLIRMLVSGLNDTALARLEECMGRSSADRQQAPCVRMPEFLRASSSVFLAVAAQSKARQ